MIEPRLIDAGGAAARVDACGPLPLCCATVWSGYSGLEFGLLRSSRGSARSVSFRH